MTTQRQLADRTIEEFVQQAESSRPGFVREFWTFVRYNKKWWLAPIIVVLLLVSLIAALGTTAAAPFIYTLF